MSLLEMLVALAIAGLIGSVAYPRLERAGQVMALRQSADILIHDLRLSRAAALRRGMAVSVLPAGGGRGYVLPGGVVREMPDGVWLEPGAGGLRFFRDGTAAGDGFVIAIAGRRVGVLAEPGTGTIIRVEP